MSAVFHLSISELFTLKYVAFSSASLLVYDYLITLPPEVEYIWKAPWTAVKTGFLINRYGNLVGQIVIAYEQMGLLSHSSQKFCVGWFLYCTFFMLFSGESIRLIVIMRAWVIWGCTYRAGVWLFTLYLIYLFTVVGIACYLWEHGYGSALPPVDGVCVTVIPPYSWLLWFAVLLIDSIVLVVVYNGLCRTFKGSRAGTSPFIRLLVRDAILFYATSLFNSVFSMICWSAFRQDSRNFLQLVLSVPLLSVAGQRLVLNLRSLRTNPWTSRDVSRMIDQELAAMGNMRFWDPVDGSSEIGTTDFALETVDR
ncbi:hypothetical protein JVU11DRAFT_6621 [Chiua virens]|nr:hypothetical protein JVU11DRAFT_6621 [Chiua virens]